MVLNRGHRGAIRRIWRRGTPCIVRLHPAGRVVYAAGRAAAPQPFPIIALLHVIDLLRSSFCSQLFQCSKSSALCVKGAQRVTAQEVHFAALLIDNGKRLANLRVTTFPFLDASLRLAGLDMPRARVS